MTDLRIGSLHEVGKVNVTEWQVKNALLLAEEGFLGEFILESHQKKVRICKSNLHHLTMATHLDCSSLAQPSNYRIMVRRGIEPTTFGMASVAFVIDHNCSGLAFSTGIPATPQR